MAVLQELGTIGDIDYSHCCPFLAFSRIKSTAKSKGQNKVYTTIHAHYRY